MISEFSGVSIIQSPRPDLRASPGQFFLAVPPRFGPYLPRVVFPFRLRDEFAESFILPHELQAWARTGELNWRGPHGRGFLLPARMLRALVLAQDALAGAQLVSLVEALVVRGCEVTVLCEPNDRMERWLPAEVEYRAAQDVLNAAAELWDWADAVYACGSTPFYAHLRTAARQSRLVFQNGWAQILVRDLPMPCGMGACYTCALKTARGVVLNCQDGPVFDLADWIVSDYVD